ncbi:MAG TPA: CAP domain-containing protein [Gaiellaceae bacterium]|nr:CAP domain-containing protein [Gaiellaceae bacterium]
MTRASAAAPVRLVVTATALALAVAVVLVGRADGAGHAWSAYLAPSEACPGAVDRNASPALQARSVRCLVNWARAQARRPGLRPSRALRRAAVLKGRGVASCGELSHAPCSSRVTDAVRRSGYRYSTFGENLFAGIDRHVSARDVVAAWLQSPPHRANILRPGFREVGFAGVAAPGFFGDGNSVVWVAAFGART